MSDETVDSKTKPAPNAIEERHRVRKSFVDDLKRLGASPRLIRAAEKASEGRADSPRRGSSSSG